MNTASDDVDITRLIAQARSGDQEARQEVFSHLLRSLRQRAYAALAAEQGAETLQATALVNEACIQLIEQKVLEKAPNRRFVYAAANRAMQQILINHARARKAQKRGGEWKRTAIELALIQIETRNGCSVDELYHALDDLEQKSPRLREVVELRFFQGLTVDETASVLECHRRTVIRDWTLARAILFDRLRSDSFSTDPE